MIRKNIILLFAFALIASALPGQNSSGGATGDCNVGFRSVLLVGAPNVVNFYADSVLWDASLGIEPLWFWDFGDGETSTEKDPVHTYNVADNTGSFLVTLTLVLGDYCKTSVSEQVYLGGYVPQACTASFYWYFNDSIKFFAEAYAISFMDQSWSGDSKVTEWYWDFGDGQTSNEQNPIHFYQPLAMSPMPPDFLVSLKIKTENGCESGYSQLVTLKHDYVSECQAYFSYEPAINVITIPELIPIQFHDYSKGTVISRLWNFGDGTTSEEVSPVHNYDFLAGPYIATLTITTDIGCSSSYSEYIRTGSINDECKPTFYYSRPDSIISIPELIPYQFFDVTEGDVIKRSWDFGDGTWSDEKAPLHNFYFEGGEFMVTLTIVTASGCENSYSEYLYIGGPIIYPVDTCPYYINVITGENPLTDNICNGTATAALFDYNGQQFEIEKFYWSNGDEGISTGNLCFNSYYSVKTVAPGGCPVYSDFVLYNGGYIDSVKVDPGIDWDTFNDSLYYYFNYNYATDPSLIYVWDFGDGQIAEGANVSHEYADNGYYNVTLSIIDSTGLKVFTKAMEVNNATSVQKTGITGSYSIFPNPVADMLNLNIQNEQTARSTVSVIDVSGKLWLSKSFGPGLSENVLQVSVSNLPSGMYFAKITSSGVNPVILKFTK